MRFFAKGLMVWLRSTAFISGDLLTVGGAGGAGGAEGRFSGTSASVPASDGAVGATTIFAVLLPGNGFRDFVGGRGTFAGAAGDSTGIAPPGGGAGFSAAGTALGR